MGKSKKKQCDGTGDQEVSGDIFYKSLTELKQALSVLGFEITPKKTVQKNVSSPIADVIKESRKRKLSSSSNTDACEPELKKHKHGKHRHKRKEVDTSTESEITVSGTGQKYLPLNSTPLSSGKFVPRPLSEYVPAFGQSSQSSSSDFDVSVVKMSPLNSSRHKHKTKKDQTNMGSEVSPNESDKRKSSIEKTKVAQQSGKETPKIDDRKSQKKLQKSKSTAELAESTQDNVSPFGRDWTRQELAAVDAKKLNLLEKYFIGKKSGSKDEKSKITSNKQKKTEKTNLNTTGSCFQTDKNNLIEKEDNHSEMSSIKSPKKFVQTSNKDKKETTLNSTGNRKQGNKQTLGNKVCPAEKPSTPTKKPNIESPNTILTPEVQKNTDTIQVDKTAKKHSVETNHPVTLVQYSSTEVKKKADKKLKINKDSKDTEDIDTLMSKKKSHKKKKKKSKKKSKEKHEHENEPKESNESSPSKKVRLLEAGSEYVSREAKKPKVTEVYAGSSDISRNDNSFFEEGKIVENLNSNKNQSKISSKEESKRQAKRKLETSENTEYLPTEESSKKKIKKKHKQSQNISEENTVTEEKTSPVLYKGSKDKTKDKPKSLGKSTVVEKASKVIYNTTVSNVTDKSTPETSKKQEKPLMTQLTSKAKATVKSKKLSKDEQLFSESFDFEAWEEKMKMIELLKSGGNKMEEKHSEDSTIKFVESLSPKEQIKLRNENNDEIAKGKKKKKKEKKKENK